MSAANKQQHANLVRFYPNEGGVSAYFLDNEFKKG